MRKPSRHVVNSFSCAENAFITIRTGFTPPWLHAEIPHLSATTFASSETCVFSDRVLMSALTCTPAAGFITACHTCACRLLSHLSFVTVRWASLQSERRGSVEKLSMGGRSHDTESECNGPHHVCDLARLFNSRGCAMLSSCCLNGMVP